MDSELKALLNSTVDFGSDDYVPSTGGGGDPLLSHDGSFKFTFPKKLGDVKEGCASLMKVKKEGHYKGFPMFLLPLTIQDCKTNQGEVLRTVHMCGGEYESDGSSIGQKFLGSVLTGILGEDKVKKMGDKLKGKKKISALFKALAGKTGHAHFEASPPEGKRKKWRSDFKYFISPEEYKENVSTSAHRLDLDSDAQEQWDKTNKGKKAEGATDKSVDDDLDGDAFGDDDFGED